jgi:hypothetical protein
MIDYHQHDRLAMLSEERFHRLRRWWRNHGGEALWLGLAVAWFALMLVVIGVSVAGAV